MHVDVIRILDGSIAIFDLDRNGHPNVVTTHGERQFAGELALFKNRATIVPRRTGVPSRMVRDRRAECRRLVAAAPGVGAIMMRRAGPIYRTRGGVVLIGLGHNAAALRLRNTLTRDGYPHRAPGTAVAHEAAGVPQGSVERVAPGVGEGAVVIPAVHGFLDPGVA